MEQINVKLRVFHLNILPPHSLLMLTSMSFPKHQTTLRNAPHLKKQQDKDHHLILSGTTRSLGGRNFSEKAAGICLIGRAARHKHQLRHHTPPPPPLPLVTELCADWIEHCGPSLQSCGNKTCQHVQSM